MMWKCGVTARAFGLLTIFCGIAQSGTWLHRSTYFTEDAFASASANGGFGWLNGSLDVLGIRHGYGYAEFAGTFSDYVRIDGPAASGTLAALFDIQLNGRGVEFQLLAGSATESYTSAGLCGDNCTLSAPFAVFTPFTFGEWTRIGAYARGYGETYGGGQGSHAALSLSLTGFLVPDAAGAAVFVPVGDAVRRDSGENFFPIPPFTDVPEPGTFVLLTVGFLAGALRRASSSRYARRLLNGAELHPFGTDRSLGSRVAHRSSL